MRTGSYARRERERCIAAVVAAGGTLDLALALLRNGRTLARLSEAQCNGDWPCDNGERKVKPCSRCEGGYAPSTLLRGGLCPDCRAEDRVKELLPDGWSADFAGDPRGFVLTVKTPNGATIGVA